MSNAGQRQWKDVSLTLLTFDERTLYDDLARNYFWRNGSKLRVYLMDGGTPFQRIRVKTLLASNWESYSNIKFVDAEDIANSDVRVELHARDKTNESVVGVPPESEDGLATLLLSFAPNGRFRYYQRDDQSSILHEFGHVLGLEHEHQRHDRPFEFDQPALYGYRRKSTSNSDHVEGMKNNWLETYQQRIDYRPPYDRTSIMHYDFPARVTRPLVQNGIQMPFEPVDAPINFRMSKNDRLTIASIYPQPRGGTLSPCSTMTNPESIFFGIPQTPIPRLILGMQSMCWLSIPQNAKCTLSISGTTGEGFGLLAEIDNGGCVQPSYVAVDPGIQQIYVPVSRMRFPNKEDRLQKLIHDQFVFDGELPTIITWISGLAVGSQDAFGSVKINQQELFDKDINVRSGAIHEDGVFINNVSFNTLFLSKDALNICGSTVNLYCGASNRRRPSRPQHRTIEVPITKFSKRPRIITGLSGITWARNNGGQICQTCYEPNTAKSAYDLHLYNLRNLNIDFFFEIVIDGKGSWENIKDGNYVFRWTVYHSESISELSFCWVAVVDENCFKQEAEDEGYGPETPPKKGKTRRAITPKHKQEKVCKKRRVVDGEHLGCAKCLLYDPDDELKNDEFREEGARDEDDTDDGAMDVD